MGLQVCGRGAGTEPAVLAPSPPCWLRQRVLRWQGGSCCGARAGCSAGHVQPQSPARCHCQGVQEFFLPRASQLGVSVPLSTCQRRRSACNSFDAAPPTQPLQHRCGCVIPQLSYLHLAQHSCLRAAPALPGAAAAARPHTRLPCPPCPAATSLGFTHFTSPELAGGFPVALRNSGVGNRRPPLAQLRLLLWVFPFCPARTWAKSKTRPELSCLREPAECLSLFQGRVSSGIHPAASPPCSQCHCTSNTGHHRSKSHEAPVVQGVVLSVCVPCSNSEASWLLQSQHSPDHSVDSDSCRTPVPMCDTTTPEGNSRTPVPTLLASCTGFCTLVCLPTCRNTDL